MQAEQQITPSYQLIEAADRTMPNNSQSKSRIGINPGSGIGKSKKAAEMEAARIALKNQA